MIVSGANNFPPFHDYGTQGKGHGRLGQTTLNRSAWRSRCTITYPGSCIYTMRKIKLGLVRVHDDLRFEFSSEILVRDVHVNHARRVALT